MMELVELIDEHPHAVEAELIGLGLRLRDLPSRWFTWRDFLVVVRTTLEGQQGTSPLCRAVFGPDVLWGLTDQLVALCADRLEVLAWMKTEDATKGRNYPKPLPRPGVVDEDRETKVYGSDPVPLADLDAFLGWAA